MGLGRELDLAGAVVVLTGGTSGIGRATARLLAPLARRLVVQGPEPDGRRVLDQGVPDTSELEYVSGDFRRLASAAAVAEAVAERCERVDVLINNAGVPGSPRRSVTADGHETTLQVNLLAGALLTDRLLPAIPAGGRIINVASATHYGASLDLDDLELARTPYSPAGAYAHSKLAIVAYSAWLTRQPAAAGIDVVSVHPGVVSTGLLHAMFGPGGEPATTAASVLVDLSRRPLKTGAYYDEDRIATPNSQALDHTTQDRLAGYVLEAISPFADARRKGAR